MAITERLALIIDADGQGAVRELNRVGSAAERDLGKVESGSERMSASMVSAGSKMVATSAVLGVALWNAAGAASDLNESVDYSGRVFGEASGQVADFAESADAIGLSERAAHEAATTFGDLLKATKASKTETAAMSIELTKLAADMASAKNTSPDEAVEALGAALRGESEPIRRYGVLLDDATLKAKALDMGLIESATGTLPLNIKMQAAYAEILAQTSGMQGNFTETADGAANKGRVLAAEMENAKASIGEGFLPVMSSTIGMVSSLTSGIGGLNETTGGAVGQLAAATTVVLGVGGAASFTGGKIMAMRASLQASAAAGSTWSAAMLAAMGPVAVSAAALAGIYVTFNAAMAQGDAAATDMGNAIRENLAGSSFDEAKNKFVAINGQIVELDQAIKNSRAPWDAAYRASLSHGGAELMNINESLGQSIGITEELARATGDSEQKVWSFVLAEAEAGRTFKTTDDALKAYVASAGESEEATVGATRAQEEAVDAYEKATSELDKLLKKVDEYAGRVRSATDLDVGWHQSIDALSTTVRENGIAWNYVAGQLDVSTEAGRANWSAMKDAADAALDMGEAAIRAGGGVDDAASATNQYAANLRGQLQMLGYNNEMIDELFARLGIMPDQVQTMFNQPGMVEAITNAGTYSQQLDRLNGRVVTTTINSVAGVTVPYAPANPFVTGFPGAQKVPGAATGGYRPAGWTGRVGENGPEIIKLAQGAHITDAESSKGYLRNVLETLGAMKAGGKAVRTFEDGGAWFDRAVGTGAVQVHPGEWRSGDLGQKKAMGDQPVVNVFIGNEQLQARVEYGMLTGQRSQSGMRKVGTG